MIKLSEMHLLSILLQTQHSEENAQEHHAQGRPTIRYIAAKHDTQTGRVFHLSFRGVRGGTSNGKDVIFSRGHCTYARVLQWIKDNTATRY